MAIDFDMFPHPYQLLTRSLERAAERYALELRLSESEQSVLAGILIGLSNDDIAETLDASRGEVKWHTHQIFEKSGHKNREALTRHVLLYELKHYRDRVQVTDLDIVGVGLDPEASVESPHLLAWISSRDEFEVSPEVGIYRTYDNGDRSLVIHATGVEGPGTLASVVNTLAGRVGRAPLDVLDEIAGSQPPSE